MMRVLCNTGAVVYGGSVVVWLATRKALYIMCVRVYGLPNNGRKHVP